MENLGSGERKIEAEELFFRKFFLMTYLEF